MGKRTLHTKPPPKKCRRCGTLFQPKTFRQRCCSKACGMASARSFLGILGSKKKRKSHDNL